jgi:arylsulfatase A-like enzyme
MSSFPGKSNIVKGRAFFFYFCLLFFAWAVGSAKAADRPNVLLLTVDTFRPDRLSGQGNARHTSPHLDRLAQDGVVFEQAISSSSWTTPGLMSVLTGLFAPTHAVDVRGKSLQAGTETMASLLDKAGYSVPDILYLSSIPNFQNLGLSDTYIDRDKFLPMGDEVLFRALEAYRDSTFFLYYHYRNLHLPYKPSKAFGRLYTPEGFDRSDFVRDKVETVQSNVTIPVGTVRFDPKDRDWILGLYDGQIREMDEMLFKPLIEKLKELGLYENTLLIVTADHGEELLDHGFIGHPSTSFIGSAYDELLHIPLIMSYPNGLPKNLRIGQQVQNVDILPTVMDLLNLPIPETVQGRSLMPLILGLSDEELPAFTETTPGGYQATPEMMKTRVRAMRTSLWKLIHTHGPGVDTYALYHLKEDPKEKKDVAAEHPAVVDQMRAALHQWVLLSQPADPTPLTEGGATPQKPISVLFPAEGDTFRYADMGNRVSVRWTGPEDSRYTMEYRVGQENYHLEGTMQILGNTPQYGPFTDEMWNMLALYNPWSFRITVDGRPDLSSPWVSFSILPTEDAAPPGVWTKIRLVMVFWWGEGALLVGGICDGLLDLLRLAVHFPLVDLVSAALMLAILLGILQPVYRRLGPHRATRWGLSLLYTSFIYATLGVMPTIWRALWGYTQGRIDMLGGGVTILALVFFMGMVFARKLHFFSVAGLLALSSVYIWLLLQLGTSPAERLHLAEYGLLSFFVYRALVLDLNPKKALLLAWAIVIVLGAGDEMVQWILPTRVFEWKDVGLNAVSGGLGLLIVAILHRDSSSKNISDAG